MNVEGLVVNQVKPEDTFLPLANANQKEFLHITNDGKVIITGDIYKAAVEFWKLVQDLAPLGYKLEVLE